MRKARHWWQVVMAVVGGDELVVLVAVLLLAGGFWMAWKPGALLVPGAVLLWIALPTRRRFIEHIPAPPSARRA